MEEKLFELEEANQHITRFTAAFGRIQVIKQELTLLLEDLKLRGFEPTIGNRRQVPDQPETREKTERFYRLLDALRAEVQNIESTGGVVKDVDMGLVDFYGLREGRVVCLCWQYGEPEIMYWHEVDTGFSGRKPLASLSEAQKKRLH